MDGDGQEGEDTPVTEGAVVVLGDEALARAARTNGHDIRVASDTEELLDLVTAGTDAVLVGSSPGGLTAVEVTALVRDRHPTVPVVVTAADKRRRAAAAAAGATDTLPTADPEAVTGALSAATGERAATADPDRVDEHRRRRELERYEAIVESIDDSTFVVGADGTLEYVNTRLSDQAGMSESALVGAEVRSLAGALTADPEGLDRFEAALTAVQTGDRDTARLDLELVLPDGPAVADFGLSALDSATGERKVVGVARDVTEQRERRRELEEFEAVLETVDDAVFILDEALEVEYANGEAADRAGYPRPELRGMDALALAVPLVTTDTAEHELRAALTAVRDGESEFERLELPLDLPGGHTVTDFQFSALSVGGERKVIAIGRDITALKRRERELREEQTFTETVLDTVPDVFYALDEHGNAVRWNDRLVSVTGYSDAELATMDPLELLADDDAATADAAMDAVLRGESRTFEAAIETKDGEAIPHEFVNAPLTDGDGAVVGCVGAGRDISERRRRERTLDELHRTTRELVRSESVAEVARRVADAANVVIDAAGAAVMLLDEAETALRREALVVDDDTEADYDPGLVGPDPDHPAWRAFAEGEPVVAEDLAGPDGPREVPFGSAVYLPLGDRGVFVVADPEPGGIEERTVELAEVLASNARAALARIERETALREREQELSRRTDRLRRLDEVNERVRRIAHEVVGATTREEVVETVCERLAGSDRFALAWVGEAGPGGTVTPGAWAGDERGYLDAVEMDRGTEPAVRAATDRELAVVDNVADSLREGDWQREALTRGFGAVLAVPLVSGGVPYGVLAVYAESAGTFDEQTRAVFEELGLTVASALGAVEQRQALVADHHVELEFDLGSDGTTPVAFARRLGADLTVDRVLPQSGERALAYGTVAGADPEAVREAAAEMVAVDRARVLAEGEPLRVELRLTGGSVADLVADHGGVFGTLTVTDGDARVRATFPASANVGEFVDAFVDRVPGAELLARRERGATADRPALESVDLTDRQHDVLTAAHHAGFFEWPRESTGEEVADSLDISPPTFQEHLRRAQAKLVAALLDGSQSL